MYLTPTPPRAHFWILTTAELMFLAVTCFTAWLAAGIEEDPEAMAMFAFAALGSACLTAMFSVFKQAGKRTFRWRVVDGVLAGEWTPDDSTARLPLSGRLQIDSRMVYPGDDGVGMLWATAFHESPRFGRVELMSECSEVKPTQQELWRELDLRGTSWIAARGEAVTLPCGWTTIDRLVVCLGFGTVLFPFGGAMLAHPGLLLVFLSVGLALLGWVLVRSMASVELRRTRVGVEWRRVVGSRALGRWKDLARPDILDLTEYPRVEWRTADGGRSLRVLGSAKGLRPVDALRVTEWMRDHPALDRPERRVVLSAP